VDDSDTKVPEVSVFIETGVPSLVVVVSDKDWLFPVVAVVAYDDDPDAIVPEVSVFA